MRVNYNFVIQQYFPLGLKPDSISSIPAEAMQGLKPRAIKALPPASFIALTPQQISKMSFDAAATVQPSQLNSLSPSQADILRKVIQIENEEFDVAVIPEIASDATLQEQEARSLSEQDGINGTETQGRSKGDTESTTKTPGSTTAVPETTTSTPAPPTGPTEHPESEVAPKSIGTSITLSSSCFTIIIGSIALISFSFA
jgi:hypothetical protein